METSKAISTAVLNEVNKTRQYGMESGWDTTITKVWNRGMGRLQLLTIYEGQKLILINSALWNYSDQKHFQNIVANAPELKDYKVVKAYYGYPIYYNYGFCLKTFKKMPHLVSEDTKEVFETL